jgi:hypothetical protein
MVLITKSRQNWDPPTPSPASEYNLLGTNLGDTHSPAGEGVGESQFGRLEKRLSTLPTIWFISKDSYCASICVGQGFEAFWSLHNQDQRDANGLEKNLL